MENQRIFQIFCLSDKSHREDLLRCITKEKKTAFCTSFVSEFMAKSIPLNSNVQLNIIDHCQQKLLNLIDYTTKVEDIRTVISWIKNRNITFEDVINSAEASAAYQILTYKDSTDSDFKIAGELLKMTVLLIDDKNFPSYDVFIRKILELNVLLAQEMSMQKLKVLCQIFTSLGEKVFQQSDENIQQNEKILTVLSACANFKPLCENMFSFLRKLPSYLKSNRKYELFIEEFIKALLKHCYIGNNINMETNANIGLMVFRENASEVLKELVPAVNLLKLLEFLYIKMKNGTVAEIEVCLFVIASVAKKIDISEDKIVPKIVKFIFKFDEKMNQSVLAISFRLLGQLDGWVSIFHHLFLIDSLNFLAKFIYLRDSTSSVAMMAIGQICYGCSTKMEPHLKTLFEIFKNLSILSILSRAELTFIKGITCAVCNSKSPIKPQLKYFCELHFERILEAQKTGGDISKLLDQLAEIYDNIKVSNSDDSFGDIFIQHWSVISNLLDAYLSNSLVMKKIVECIECAISNLGISVLPVLDQIVKQLMYYYAVGHYDFVLKLMSVVVDKLGSNENLKDGLMIMFEGVSILTFNALHDEKELNFPVVEEYFHLASTCMQKMTLEMLKRRIILPIIELSIGMSKIDNKNANRLVIKFLTTIFISNRANFEIKLCIEQAMTKYCESIIKILMESMIFFYDVSLICNVAEIFIAMKDKSLEGFNEVFCKMIRGIRRKNQEGKITVTDANINDLIDLMKRPKLSRTDMINGLTDFRKLVRG